MPGPKRHRLLLLSAFYAAGILLALTAYAAVLQYIVDPDGHSLGKVGFFGWVWVINFLLALPALVGFRIGLSFASSGSGDSPRWHHPIFPLLLGALFVPTIYAVRPVLGLLGLGLLPTIGYLFVGSLFVPLVVNLVAGARDSSSRR
jgi:hypothetical protein